MSKLLIFSDESGRVYDSDDGYYVRSFVFIHEEQYKILDAELEKIKEDCGIADEIKFKNFRNAPERYGSIFEIPFWAYICFTDVKSNFLNSEYEQELFFDIRRVITDHKKSYLEKRVVDTVRSELWLEYFERYYIANSKRIAEDFFDISGGYEYVIDEPPFNKKSYRNMLEKCGLLKGTHNLVDSKNHTGIQLADIFAGSFAEILKKGDKLKDEPFFPVVWNKLLHGASQESGQYGCRWYPNPCHIHTIKDEEKKNYYNDLLRTRWLYMK